MPQPRIAFVLPSFRNRDGGPVTVAKNVGRRLAKMGNEVSYWAPGDERDSEDNRQYSGVHLFERAAPHAWRYSRGMGAAFLQAAPQLDVIHVYQLWTHHAWIARAAALAAKKPYVLRTAGDLEPWRLRNTLLKRIRKSAYLSLIGGRVIRDSVCLHAASHQEIEGYRKLGYTGAATIIPNGADIDFFAPGSTREVYNRWPEFKGRPLVLFLSRLSPEKGIDKLIQVWGRVIAGWGAENPLLVLAGPDDRGYAEEVQRMVDEAGLGMSIRQVGMIHGELKAALYRAAHCLILPSYNENFGLVVAEALASGTPVVTTTNTPWSMLNAHDCGWWVENSEQALFTALNEVFETSLEERKAMGERGRRFIVEHHSWDTIARKLITLNDCIIQGRPIPTEPEPSPRPEENGDENQSAAPHARESEIALTASDDSLHAAQLSAQSCRAVSIEINGVLKHSAMPFTQKIAFVLTSMRNAHGGPVTVAKDIGRKLSAFDQQVSYWAPGEEAARQECSQIPGVHLFERRRPRRWQYSPALGDAFRAAAPGFDIIYILEFWTYHAWMAHDAALRARKPYMLQAHGSLEPWRLRNSNWKMVKKHFYLSAFGRRLMRDAACMHAASDQEVQSYRALGYDGPAAVIANGVDTEIYRPGTGDGVYHQWPELQGRPFALFMSRLSLEKGLDKLIAAWPRFVADRGGQKPLLLIAGPDDRGYGTQVRGMISRAGADESIRMLGMIEGELKLALYRAAQCFILPSYNENYGIVIAEAMAVGAPVITTVNTPWRVLKDENAGWWIEQTEEEIRRSLNEAFDMSASDRGAMGLRARAAIERDHSLDAAALKFIAVNQCIAEGREIPLHPEPAQWE